MLRYSQIARSRSSLALTETADLLLIGHRRLRLLHALHVALAILAAAEAHLVHAPRDGLLGARRQAVGIGVLAQQFGVADDARD